MKKILKTKYISIIFLTFLLISLLIFTITCFYHYSGQHNVWNEMSDWKIDRAGIEKTYISNNLDDLSIKSRTKYLDAISSAYIIATIIPAIFMPLTILTSLFLLADIFWKNKSEKMQIIFDVSLLISFFLVVAVFVLSILSLTNTLNVINDSWMSRHITGATAGI